LDVLWTVNPRADDEPLSAPGRFRTSIVFESLEILESSTKKSVEPAAEMVDRGIDLRELHSDVPLPPVRTVVWVGKPLVIPVAQSSQERARREWPDAEPGFDILVGTGSHLPTASHRIRRPQAA